MSGIPYIGQLLLFPHASKRVTFPSCGNTTYTSFRTKRRTVLYIGVTNNLERRVDEHRVKRNDGFTNWYNCDCLVYYEEYSHVQVAIAREKRLKKYPRRWKENLIQEFNPEWEDLSMM